MWCEGVCDVSFVGDDDDDDDDGDGDDDDDDDDDDLDVDDGDGGASDVVDDVDDGDMSDDESLIKIHLDLLLFANMTIFPIYWAGDSQKSNFVDMPVFVRISAHPPVDNTNALCINHCENTMASF